MQPHPIAGTVDRLWNEQAMPLLLEYIAIPCLSPDFDPDWSANGHLDASAELLATWARTRLAAIAGAAVEIIRLPGRTPTILIEIPGDEDGGTIIYGHHDKQPPMDGWTNGRGAWQPSLEGDRLYGRGGADDGYALPSAIIAVLALREAGARHPRITILIEGSEESGSFDLAPTIDHLAGRLGTPSTIIALDAGCGNYGQLWRTTSVRGQIAGTLAIRTLREGVHSGDASGIVPSSFRIARQLLSRLEDAATGVVADPAFNTDIPDPLREEAVRAGEILGADIHGSFPVAPDAAPVAADPAEQLLNRTWRPQLTVTGLDGLPPVAHAAAVLQPALAIKLSLRLPPTVDPGQAGERLKAMLELDPPYGCEVRFTIDMTSQGWTAPPLSPQLGSAIEKASMAAFGQPPASFGGGGGIPFLAMLADRYPHAQFLVTGVLGPQSNAHGPNEFLHLPTARRLTAALAMILGVFH